MFQSNLPHAGSRHGGKRERVVAAVGRTSCCRTHLQTSADGVTTCGEQRAKGGGGRTEVPVERAREGHAAAALERHLPAGRAELHRVQAIRGGRDGAERELRRVEANARDERRDGVDGRVGVAPVAGAKASRVAEAPIPPIGDRWGQLGRVRHDKVGGGGGGGSGEEQQPGDSPGRADHLPERGAGGEGCEGLKS